MLIRLKTTQSTPHDPWQELDLERFLEVNADGLSDEDIADIRATLDRGEEYFGGGGATAVWSIVRADAPACDIPASPANIVELSERQLKLLEGIAAEQGHDDPMRALDFLIEQAAEVLSVDPDKNSCRM
jgi:hypothetical protein